MDSAYSSLKLAGNFMNMKMGSLILSSSGLSLEKLSANWLVNPLMYFTLKYYGKGLTNKCCSPNAVWLRLVSRKFYKGCWSVSYWHYLPIRKWQNFSKVNAMYGCTGDPLFYSFKCLSMSWTQYEWFI